MKSKSPLSRNFRSGVTLPDDLLLPKNNSNRKRLSRILFFLLLTGLFYCGALSSRAQTPGLSGGSSELAPSRSSQAVLTGMPDPAPASQAVTIQKDQSNSASANLPAASPSQGVPPALHQSSIPAATDILPMSGAPLNGTPSARLAVNSPAAQSPAAQSPAAQSPAAQSPAAQSPAAQSPAAQSQAAQLPAAQSQAAQSPAAQSPAEAPISSLPASGGSVKDHPRLPVNPQIEDLLGKTEFLTSEKGIVDSLKVFLVLTVLSLVPAIFMMTTSFIRLVTVLSILRQALGTGQIPPNQVITALSVFLTFLIMIPTWTEVYEKSLVPYSHQEITATQAFERGQLPIRTFLWKQIEKTGNTDMIWTFMKYAPDAKTPQYYEEIPWRVLLPAFMLSELKTAFLIGFQIFLPFVIIDMIISAVMVSMGMMMLPPTVISLPFKLLLFVLMDGWSLTAKMLLESFTWLGTGG